MAVATEREYGLFINGELVEPQAGEIRELTEPATGELLARAAMAGEAEVDRAKSVLVSTSSKPFNPFGL